MNITSNAVELIQRRYPELRERKVTETVIVGRGALSSIGDALSELPGSHTLLVADPQTYEAAGHGTEALLRSVGLSVERCILPEHPVATPQAAKDIADLARNGGHADVPKTLVAVGAGTINDIVKLAAHRLGRPYASVGTALSMNGYTSSICALLDGGVKRTVPATPAAIVVLDLDICADAPVNMTQAGFGDMLSKPFSEADWRLSNVIDGVPWHPAPSELLSGVFDTMVSKASGIGRGDPNALEPLAHSILLSGMSMAFAGVSSPASGGEHLISHYWDMGQYALGLHPFALHGTQVGVACCLVEPLHHRLSRAVLTAQDISRALSNWPKTRDEAVTMIDQRHSGMPVDIRAGIIEEALVKWRSPDEQRARLLAVVPRWPELSGEWAQALLPEHTVRQAMYDVGGPTVPSQIAPGLADSLSDWLHVRDMRRRYTVLDFAIESGLGIGETA